MSLGVNWANRFPRVYMSYLRQPAKNELNTLLISDSGLMSLNSWSTKRFDIDGWSTIILKSTLPPLSVFWYVYIGSDLPINVLVSNFVLISSLKSKL